MTGTADRINYEERLSRVIDYIYGHLDDDIDLAKLADIACLSPYHWHRTYHALKGETIAATVKRLRLHRAAGFLAHTQIPIEEIAARSGYGSAEAFSRAFKEFVGLPPAKYRSDGSHTRFGATAPDAAAVPHDVTIRTVPTMHAVSVGHAGSYMMIGRAFDTLFTRWGATGLPASAAPRMIGVYYDDPAAVPEAALRSSACVVVDAPMALLPPLEMTEIRGGRYAVLRYTGPYADMRGAYRWLCGEWLVGAGAHPDEAPILEEYLNSPRDTPAAELRTDISLPLV